MKRALVATLTMLSWITVGCGSRATPVSDPSGATEATLANDADEQSRESDGGGLVELTPPGLEGIQLGMPKASFRVARPGASEVPGTAQWSELDEESPLGPIEQVSFYFAATPEQPLYEIIAVYRQPGHAASIFDKQYRPLGSLVAGERYDTVSISKPGVETRAWAFDRSLIVVAILPGTDWWERVHGSADAGDDP